MKIVKFEDGRYGIRKKSYGVYRFLDLQTGLNFWWSQDCEYFNCCKGNYEEVKKAYLEINDPGKPIEPSFLNKLIKAFKSIEWSK